MNSAAVHTGDVSAPAVEMLEQVGTPCLVPLGNCHAVFHLLPSHPQCTRAPSLATILSGYEPEGIALFLKTDLMKSVNLV